MKKIFITGATGFLGSNLARRLAEGGDDITILVRKGSDHPFLKNLPIKRVEGDVTDLESLKAGIKNMDLVFHCAGVVSYRKSDESLMHRVNVIGTDNVCRASMEEGVKKLLYVSSTAAVGIPKDPAKPADESYPFHKKWLKIPYMHSKKIAEENVLSYADKGLDIVSANPSTFYGAGDIKVSTGEIFRKISSGVLKSAPPGGNGVIAVEDCVDGIIKAAERGKTGERYILNAENMAFIEIFNFIAESIKKSGISRTIPGWAYSPALALANVMEKILPYAGIEPPFSPELIKISWSYRYFDSSKAKKELGWIPHVPFKLACAEAAEFYKSIGVL
jgi:dihydroflavonol-4-reductase